MTALFENLEEGASVDDFTIMVSAVTSARVIAVLEYAIQSLSEDRLAAQRRSYYSTKRLSFRYGGICSITS